MAWPETEEDGLAAPCADGTFDAVLGNEPTPWSAGPSPLRVPLAECHAPTPLGTRKAPTNGWSLSLVTRMPLHHLIYTHCQAGLSGRFGLAFLATAVKVLALLPRCAFTQSSHATVCPASALHLTEPGVPSLLGIAVTMPGHCVGLPLTRLICRHGIGNGVSGVPSAEASMIASAARWISVYHSTVHDPRG